jgi:hypothetical protein
MSKASDLQGLNCFMGSNCATIVRQIPKLDLKQEFHAKHRLNIVMTLHNKASKTGIVQYGSIPDRCSCRMLRGHFLTNLRKTPAF